MATAVFGAFLNKVYQRRKSNMANPTLTPSKGTKLPSTFRASWRNKHQELKALSDSEFRLLEFYIDAAIWDEKNHPNEFGKVSLTDKEVAECLGWRSDSKVSRNRRKLIQKGELSMEGDKRVVPNFHRYKIKTAFELAKTQERRAELQEAPADLQVIQPLPSSSQLPISRYKDSFKDEYKEDWRDYLIDREMAKEPCFCRSGKSLEDCCGPRVHESLRNSKEMVELHKQKGYN